MSLLARITAVLDRAGAPYAVIGAAAMAVHGISRSTADIDLLTLDAACLDAACWTSLSDAGAQVAVRRGDGDDPLAGVVRFDQEAEPPVDLVVGHHRWQARILARAVPAVVLGERLPVVRPHDLVLLKLFAGGAQDAWDIAQFLAGPDRDALIAAVSADLALLPPRCRRLWSRVVEAQ